MREENAVKLWPPTLRSPSKPQEVPGADLAVFALVTSMHACLGALDLLPRQPWPVLCACFITGCIGITFGYHRLIAHKSFVVPLPSTLPRTVEPSLSRATPLSGRARTGTTTCTRTPLRTPTRPTRAPGGPTRAGSWITR